MRTKSVRESKALDASCARWVFRRALPLSTTSAPEFLAMVRALNPAYCPPPGNSLSGTLLGIEFKQLPKVVNIVIHRSIFDGDVVIGDDSWTDRLLNRM